MEGIMENEAFRKLKTHITEMKTGVTNMSVIQALANMCREEESIVDHETYQCKRKRKNGVSKEKESIWLRRFIRRNSGSTNELDSDDSDTNLITRYAKEKFRNPPTEEERKINAFSTNIQELLVTMTAQFASDINDAYKSDPSQIMAIGENNPLEAILKMNQIDNNMKAIDEDMRLLAEARTHGEMTATDRFLGFSHLGENDCLLDENDSSSSSESGDADNSDDSDSDDESDQSDSDDDDEGSSDWESGDESSLDSNFMNEMANELGFEVDQHEDDETVATYDVSLVKAIASGQRSMIPSSDLSGIQIFSSNPIISKQSHFVNETSKVMSIAYERINKEEDSANESSDSDGTSDSSDSSNSDELSDSDKDTSSEKSSHVNLHPPEAMDPLQELSTLKAIQGIQEDHLTNTQNDANGHSEKDKISGTNINDSSVANQIELTGGKDMHDKFVSSCLSTSYSFSEEMEPTTATSELPKLDDTIFANQAYDKANSKINSGLVTPERIGDVSTHSPENECDEDSDDTSTRNSIEDSGENSEEDPDQSSEDESASDDESALDDEYLNQFESMLVQPPSTDSNPLNSLHMNPLQRPGSISTSCQVEDSPSSASLVQAKPIELEVFSGIGTNVGCFDKNGRPNEKAASRGKRSKIEVSIIQVSFSDICAAAMLATAAAEDIPPFPDLPKRIDTLESIAAIDDNSSCYDGLDDNSIARSNISNRATHFIDGFNDKKTKRRGSILVDWNSRHGDLLVDWGEDYSDPEDEYPELKPIVSTWKPSREYSVALCEGKKLDECGSSGMIEVWCPKRVSICSDTDSESTLSEIRRSETKYASEHELLELHDESGPFIYAMQRKGQYRKKGLNPSHRHVSFRNAFQHRIAPEIPEESEEMDTKELLPGVKTLESDTTMEKKESEQELTIIFPRIDFHAGSKKIRRSKKGENCSLSTRRRRKIRVNEIKSAMVEEKGYIEGLFMLSKATGKTIGCEIKSKI